MPLLTVAEDLESISDLHALCRIMKLISTWSIPNVTNEFTDRLIFTVLMNDNTIMEQIVLEEYIVGVVGILECTMIWHLGFILLLISNKLF